MRIQKFITLFSPFAVALLLLSSCRSADSYIRKGQANVQGGKLDDAILDFRNAIRKNPQSGLAYYHLGKIFLQQGKYNDAYQVLRRAAELEPRISIVQIAYADLCLASYLSDPSRSSALLEQIDKAAGRLLEIDPDSHDGFRIRAHQRLIEKRYQEALEFFEKANKTRPNRPALILAWVQALAENGRKEEAERRALEFVNKPSDFLPVYDFLYRMYRDSGRLNDAETILERRIRTHLKDADVLLDLCQFYHETGKTSQVGSCIERLLKGYPLGHVHAGNFYRKIGNLPEARRHYEEGLKSDPAGKTAYQKALGSLLFSTNKQEEGIRLLEQVLQEKADEHEVRLMLATMQQSRGNFAAAASLYDALVKAKKADAEVWLRLANCHGALLRTEDARKSYKEAIRLRRDYLEARTALAQLEMRDGKATEAARQASDALAFAPGNSAVSMKLRLLRTAAWINQGMFGEAEVELGKILRQDPKNGEAYLQQGSVAFGKGDYEEASARFQKLYERGIRDPRVVVGWADSHAARKQWDIAIQILRQKLPPSEAVDYRVAEVQAKAGRYTDAVKLYQELARRNPKDGELQLRLGEALQLSGRFGEAMSAFQESARLNPSGATVADNAQALVRLSSGQPQEAIRIYQQVLAKEPANAIAMNNLAFLLAEQEKELERALVLAQGAVRAAPKIADFQDTLGWIYLKQKKPESAIQIFNQLVRTAPQNPTYRYHCAMAALASGDKQRARTELEEALRRKPAPDEESKIRELLRQL